MKKHISLLLALTLMLALFAGCSGGSTPSSAPESSAPSSGTPETSAPANEKSYNLDFNTPFSAEGPAGKAAVEFAKVVE